MRRRCCCCYVVVVSRFTSISIPQGPTTEKVKVKYNTQVVYTMKEMNEVGAGLQDIIPKKEGLDVGF